MKESPTINQGDSSFTPLPTLFFTLLAYTHHEATHVIAQPSASGDHVLDKSKLYEINRGDVLDKSALYTVGRSPEDCVPDLSEDT